MGSETTVKAEKKTQKITFTLKLGNSFHKKVETSFQLVDRYNYVYWLSKIFHRAPLDKVLLESYFQRPPAAALFVIPRERKKIIDKSMGYLSDMETLTIGDLNKKLLVATDRPRNSGRFFSTRTVQLIRELSSSLLYLIVDYSSPHLKLQLEIDKKHSKRAFAAMKLALSLANNIRKVKRSGKEKQTTKFLRKSITNVSKEK